MENDTPTIYRNLTVPLKVELRDRLDKRAEAEGLSPSSFVRHHITRILDQRDADKIAVTTNTSEQ